MSMAQASSSTVPVTASGRGGSGVVASSDVVATVDATATPTSASAARSGSGVPLRSVPAPASVSLPSAAQDAPESIPRARYDDPIAFRFMPRPMPTWAELGRRHFFPQRFQWTRIADVSRYAVLPGHKDAQAVWDARRESASCDLAVPANLPCDAYFLEDEADERLVRHLARLRVMRRDEFARVDPWAAAPSAGFLLDGGVPWNDVEHEGEASVPWFLNADMRPEARRELRLRRTSGYFVTYRDIEFREFPDDRVAAFFPRYDARDWPEAPDSLSVPLPCVFHYAPSVLLGRDVPVEARSYFWAIALSEWVVMVAAAWLHVAYVERRFLRLNEKLIAGIERVGVSAIVRGGTYTAAHLESLLTEHRACAWDETPVFDLAPGMDFKEGGQWLPWSAERGVVDWAHGSLGVHRHTEIPHLLLKSPRNPSRDAFANLEARDVVTVDAVLSALSTNELHVMRATDSREYAQYLGMAALLAIERRRFRDGRYSLFSEPPRAPIDVERLDAALRAEYVKVYNELQALKAASSGHGGAAASSSAGDGGAAVSSAAKSGAGDGAAAGSRTGAGDATADDVTAGDAATAVNEAGDVLAESDANVLRGQLAAAEKGREEALARVALLEGARDDALARMASAVEGRSEALARLTSVEQSRDEALARVTTIAQARDDAAARLTKANATRDEAVSLVHEAEKTLKDAAGREATLERKAGEDATRIERMHKDIGDLQERVANYERAASGNRAMITTLQERCEAATSAQERAERALSDVEANLAGERQRGAERVAAVRRVYTARERETVRRIQDTIERTHRLGTTLNDIVG